MNRDMSYITVVYGTWNWEYFPLGPRGPGWDRTRTEPKWQILTITYCNKMHRSIQKNKTKVESGREKDIPWLGSDKLPQNIWIFNISDNINRVARDGGWVSNNSQRFWKMKLGMNNEWVVSLREGTRYLDVWCHGQPTILPDSLVSRQGLPEN